MTTFGLGASDFKLFTCKGITQNRPIVCSREITIGFRENVKSAFPFAIFIQPSFPSNSSFVACSSQIPIDDEETHDVKSKHRPETARIQINLKKKCHFGQRFMLVGDDPVLGMWNPCDGVPLHWSDDHVWTAEIDVPSGKIIKYKFILMNGARIISWQPGSDRFLETRNSEKTVVTFEDWNNEPRVEEMIEEEHEMDTDVEPNIINGSSVSVTNALKDSTPGTQDANVTDEGYEGEVSGNDDKEVKRSYFSNYINRESLISDDGVPIPIPGLLLLPKVPNTGTKEEKNNGNENTLKIGSPNEVRTKEFPSSDLVYTMEVKDLRLCIKEQVEGHSILERDVHWARKAFMKLLASFGFQ